MHLHCSLLLRVKILVVQLVRTDLTLLGFNLVCSHHDRHALSSPIIVSFLLLLHAGKILTEFELLIRRFIQNYFAHHDRIPVLRHLELVADFQNGLLRGRQHDFDWLGDEFALAEFVPGRMLHKTFQEVFYLKKF